MKMKKMLALLLTCSVTAIYTGCGSSGTSDNGSIGNDEGITLAIFDQYTDADAENKPFRERLAAYQEMYPEITIEEEVLSSSDYGTKVQTLAAADELPDVFLMKGQMARDFAENGYVMDLTEMMEADSEWTEGFREGAFSNIEIDGGTYGVPISVTNTMMIYNSKLLEEVGVTEFPTTWSGFIDVCKELKDAGITPIVLGNSPLWPAESVILSTLGNRCTGTEWYENIRNNTGSSFTDSEFVLALQSLYDLAEAGAFNSDVNSIDESAQRTVYMNGEAAMMFGASWMIPILEENMSDDLKEVTELAPMPAVEGGKGDSNAITGGSGWGWAVNSKLEGEKKEAAFNFVKTIICSEMGTLYAERGLVSAYSCEEFTMDESSAMTKKYLEFIEGRPFIPVYDHQLSSGLMDVMQSGLQEILNNTKTPENLAQELQDQYERENEV